MDVLKRNLSWLLLPFQVGMHSARDCLKAAIQGATMHCIEPSPVNFKRVMSGMKAKFKSDTRGQSKWRINLYNVAAGNTSSGFLEFTAGGSTGDHVGTGDVWTMEESKHDTNDHRNVVKVPSVRMDDIIQGKRKPSWTSLSESTVLPFNSVFMLKIDTQGFEPTVFSGLTESLNQHKIQFILFEYWPRGIDFIAGSRTKCDIVVNLFNTLIDLGYTLHGTNGEAHPMGDTSEIRHLLKSKTERPFGDLRKNCMWFYDLEERFPIDGYKMGYWSDILAVAPNANIPKPTTKVGHILRNNVLYNY